MSLHGQVLLLKASCRKSFLMYPSGCTWSKKLWPGTELASCHLSALCPGTGGSPAVAFGGRWPSPPRSPEVSEQFHRQASTGSVMQSTEEQDAAFEMRWWACRLEPTRRAASPGPGGGDLGQGEWRVRPTCPGSSFNSVPRKRVHLHACPTWQCCLLAFGLVACPPGLCLSLVTSPSTVQPGTS